MAKPVKRGLNALLADIEDVKQDVMASDKVYNVPVSKIIPNSDQPRKTFNEESLIELADSVRNHGIIQPLVVKKKGGDYVIIAGERRYRAATMVGLTEVPVIIKDYDEAQTREISLIENLQREDLNAIEEAEAVRELMEIYGLTQEEVARKLGKARPSIANSLRLLNLTPEVKSYVKSGKLSAGHARALLAVTNQSAQLELAKRAILDGWSVRETEKQVKYYLKPETKPQQMSEKVKVKVTAEMRGLVDDMTRVFATKVRLIGNEQKGRISIDYYNNEDLVRIYEVIESLKK